MFVKAFEVNGNYTVCAVLPDGTMDPNYCEIPDIVGKGVACYIADRINEAFRAGKNAKLREIKAVLDL